MLHPAITNLFTGHSVSYVDDEPFYLASSAKIPIHIKLWMDIEAGRVDRNDMLNYTDSTTTGAQWYTDERGLPGFSTFGANSEMGMAFTDA